jgi:chondroitin 4-sulfotransferase 11
VILALIYSEKSNVLFTHISRTGGMTIDNCMRRLLPDARTIVGQHAPLVAARPLLGARFEQAYKFAFVRNPWDRFVSWYALMAAVKHSANPNGAALTVHDTQHWQGFDAFLENWCAQEVQIDGVRRRLLSQWAQLVDADGMLLVDDIGRFENFSADASRLLTKARIDAGSLPTLNASKHEHYSVYYSAFGRELIENVFPEDIANFGYQFESVSLDCACD